MRNRASYGKWSHLYRRRLPPFSKLLSSPAFPPGRQRAPVARVFLGSWLSVAALFWVFLNLFMVFHFGRNLHSPNGLRFWLSFHVFICSLLDLWWGIPSSLCRLSLGGFLFFSLFSFFIFEWTDCFCYTPRDLWESISGFSVPAHESACLSLGQDHTVFIAVTVLLSWEHISLVQGQSFPSFSKWCSVIFKYFFFQFSISTIFVKFSPDTGGALTRSDAKWTRIIWGQWSFMVLSF